MSHNLPLLPVWSHSTARQAHHDASNDQDGSTDPTHKQSGAKGVPEGAQQTWSAVLDVPEVREVKASLHGCQGSCEASDARYSVSVVSTVGVRCELKTLHDQVGKGRHPSDAADTWTQHETMGLLPKSFSALSSTNKTTADLQEETWSLMSESSWLWCCPPCCPFSGTSGQRWRSGSRWRRQRSQRSSRRGRPAAALKVSV